MTIRYHDGTDWIEAAPEAVKVYDPVGETWVSMFSPPSVEGTLPDGAVGDPYSATLSIVNGIAPFTLPAQNLPGGLTASVSGRTITVEGTPT